MTRIEEIRARLEAATPGPWEHGERYHICGVMAEKFGEGRCSSCRRGEPAWAGTRDINGKKMLAHVHAVEEPWHKNNIVYYDGNGNLFHVVIETDEYGLMESGDADFIAHAREDVPYLLDQLAAAEADRGALARGSVELNAQLSTALAAIDEALAMHEQMVTFTDRNTGEEKAICDGCITDWPCPTVVALLKAKEGK